MPRLLIAAGLLLVLAGILWPFLSRLPIGRLPGDILIRRQNFTFYAPITTCLLLGGAISLIMWVIRR
ncbi:hypothetical protein CFR73_15425 [Novacetimonas maltaceti]|uniref:DUF2905 domain-containing protein n=1 Tax=Novacetimonas maltaceti TaxID=1203393 RepID=A0A2S3VXM6_9PROT|nr:DUF2905 domain-containing protein [Novacetimonas maltaceti]POF61372.1 hypothetical protein KMAL_30070 [Novacetimonas maltaceti]PYD58021.1 hypothetical protein CFR73_15425 [Novacetimonas maltaceti]